MHSFILLQLPLTASFPAVSLAILFILEVNP